MSDKLKHYSILTSYLIGAPIGLFTIFITFFIPVMLTGEGLATMAITGVFGNAILGLIISFLIALWLAGQNAFSDFSKKKSLLSASFKYSLIVNSVIWTTFILITIIGNSADGKDNLHLVLIFVIIPIIAFIFCVALTTFTLGLLICFTIKRKIEKEGSNMTVDFEAEDNTTGNNALANKPG